MSSERIFRLALLVGGVADLAVGALVLVAWRWLLTLLRAEVPTNPAYVQLAGVLAVSLGLMILVAWRDPQRHRENVGVAILARFGAAALLIVLVRQGHVPAYLLWVAAAEALVGLLHLFYWRRLRAT